MGAAKPTMAIAPSIDGRSNEDRYIRSAHIDRDRLYLSLRLKLDADMLPLAADFTLRGRKAKITVTSLDIREHEGCTVLALLLSKPISAETAAELRYKPTQWLMCDAATDEAIEEFSEQIYTKSVDGLDPSLRLKTKFEKNAEVSSTSDEAKDIQASIRYASEFRVQVAFEVRLDTAVTLDIGHFRAELDDRWLHITDARYVIHRTGTPDIQLELSEPVEAGRTIKIAYRSPSSSLKTVGGSAVAAFTAEAEVEEHAQQVQDTMAMPAVDPVQQQPRRSTGGRDGTARDIGRELEQAQGREAEASAVPEFDMLMDEHGNFVTDENEPSVEEETARPLVKVKRRSSDPDADSTEGEVSLAAKFIYFVPIFIFGWLLFIICIYIATLVLDFDTSLPSSESSTSSAPVAASDSGIKRESCSLSSSDGSQYDGECLNGVRDGQGTYRWASGNRYEGTWVNGKRHGLGVLTYASGAVYEGEFADGREHGEGKMSWPNGARYEGQYKDGKFHGEGMYLSAQGNRYVGVFQNGSMSKDGFCMMQNGEEYEGPCRSR